MHVKQSWSIHFWLSWPNSLGKQFTAIAFIDLSKAFDNVRHELLLLTLQKVGVNGTVLAWFYNYLNNRQQQIVTQESSSTPFLCSKGVPQGSVLGPLLFNLYVSDLARLADERGASLPSFADDFTLYASCKDPVDACDTVSNVLGVLDKAFDTLGLQINEIKLSQCLFHRNLISPAARTAKLFYGDRN